LKAGLGRAPAGCNTSGGNCSAYAVYADGDLAYTGNLVRISDLQLKASLTPLDQAVAKLLELEVVTYEHVQSEELAQMHLSEGSQVGLVAQQVAEVMPELGPCRHRRPSGPQPAGGADPLPGARDDRLHSLSGACDPGAAGADRDVESTAAADSDVCGAAIPNDVGNGCWTEECAAETMCSFHAVQSSWYGSSSSYVSDPAYAWLSDLGSGLVYMQARESDAHVWPVRGGQ
jgi:hypothetical protein